MGKKLLIIEDNYEVRENLEEILTLSNYEVLTAPNGVIGVELASSEMPDLIICDIMMPELDGFGVLHILQKKIATASIPFIFLTAKTDQTDFRKGMSLGADDYISKPFDDIELLEAVEIRLAKAENLRSLSVNKLENFKTLINEARGKQELEKISKEHESRSFTKNQIIFMEDQFPRMVYYISSGKVKLYKTNEFGKDFITDIYHPGDFFGHIELIAEKPYSHFAAAMEETQLHVLPKDEFLSLLYANKDFSVVFIKMMANNVEQKEEQLLSMAYDSIRKKVAELLVKLSDNTPEPISMKREDFANLIGIAKESVIRTLSDFKSENLIKMKGNSIILVDKEKLAEIPG